MKKNEKNILNLNKELFFGKHNIKSIDVNEKNIASFLVQVPHKNNNNIIMQ
jgi:hypothetical protein